MKYFLRTLFFGFITCLASTAAASVTPVIGGYEVTYDINLLIGSSNGGDIQDAFIIEWNESNEFNIDYPYTIAGKGKTSISHTLDFKPTAALLIGYGLGIPNVGDEKDHVFTLTNSSFAEQVTGLKWSQAFPGIPPEPRIGHNAMITLLKDAATGNTLSLDTLKKFIVSEGYQAGFDPAENFRVLEWSVGGPIDRLDPTPVPAISVWGLGILAALLGFVSIRRRMK